jgi:predicted histone-like DNA-binding protein
MAVTYVMVERGNPSNPHAPKKFYAHAKASGEVTLKKLSKEIARNRNTPGNSEILDILNDLSKILIHYLADGKIVRFGEFGAFQITLSGKGAESIEKHTISLIKGAKMTFRPGNNLRSALDTLRYQRNE